MSIVASLVVSLAAAGAPLAAPPWSSTDLVPQSVDLYLHVDDAAGLRRELASMPLADAFRAAFVDEELRSRWSTVSKRYGRSEERSFDDLLGRDVVFAIRRSGASTDWLLATRVDEASIGRAIERLKGRMCGGGLIEFPGQGVVASWRPPMLLVASSRESALFTYAIERSRGTVGPDPDPTPSEGATTTASADGKSKSSRPERTAPLDAAVLEAPLSQHALLAHALAWPSSRIQLFIRHPEAIAGASVVTAEFSEGRASIRHRAAFDHVALSCDAPEHEPLSSEILSRFEQTALLAILRRQCDAPTSALLTGILPEAAPCDGMRQNAGDRWMLLVGDVDGEPSVPCRVPAFALAIEVREPCAGRRHHEALLRRVIEGFNARYAKLFGGEIALPQVAACADVEDPRQCEIGPALRALANNHPLVRSCSLHLRMVAGDDGNWQLYATHREWLDRVARTLEGPAPVAAANAAAEVGAEAAAPAGPPDGFDHAPEGFLDGRAAAAMIRSWGELAPEFVAKDPARFREAIGLVSSMLRGIERIRWQLDRPAEQVIESRVRVEFTRQVSH